MNDHEMRRWVRGELIHAAFVVLAVVAIVALWVADLPAQSVRLANYSALPFSGWVRTTVDTKPHAAGIGSGCEWVVGRQIGVDTWAVDVRVDMQPNEQRVAVLRGEPSKWKLGSLPADPAAHFGALFPSVGGTQMRLVSIEADGAGAAMHFTTRLGPLLHVDVWALWRPDEPGIVHGECVVCASNPSVPDIIATTDPLRLSWGDGIVFVAGAGWGAPVFAGSIANAQARGVPLVIGWPRHLEDRHWLTALAAVRRSVCAVGIGRLLPDGNPVFVGDAKAWTTDRYQESLRRLHTWEAALVGPNPRSGDTGAQEDQVFVRGECFAAGGVGAEQVAYLGALKTLARPCHHLNADGGIVDPITAAPRLIYWDGVPHWHTGVSPNRLGKAEWPTIEQTIGWAGPDVEHWFFNTTAAASRLVDSHALQWELRHQAHLYFGQWTTTPGWSTTQPYAARAVGWEGIAAVHLWRGLEDRVLAERVRAHWLKRANDVILPAWRDRDIVDIRTSDPRLGPGDWWIPWQQAVGAYGLDLAGAEFERPEIRALGLKAARVVLRDAWEQRDGRWVCRAQQSVAPPWSAGDESFNYFGLALAVAVVLRHEPKDARARAIWTQLLATPERGASWLAPGVAK